MDKTGKHGDLKEREKVHVIPMRAAEELHFSVIELGGKPLADIRCFSKTDEGLRATQFGVVLNTRKLEGLIEGAQKLLAAIKK